MSTSTTAEKPEKEEIIVDEEEDEAEAAPEGVEAADWKMASVVGRCEAAARAL